MLKEFPAKIVVAEKEIRRMKKSCFIIIQVKCELNENQYVMIRRAPHKVKLLRFNDDTFFHTINTKLWRNEGN